MSVLTADLKNKADKICANYEVKRAAILPVIRLIQETYGAISGNAELEIAEYFKIPPADVRELMTFYTLFYSEAKGKCHIQICRTLSCALRGADDLIRQTEQAIGISAGQTTPDGVFSLDAVECLGACELAPVAKVNKDYVGPLTKKDLERIISNKAPDTHLIHEAL